MRFSRHSLLAHIILTGSVVNGQASGTRTAVASIAVTSSLSPATATQACASVSSLLASYAVASPSATTLLKLPAQLAYDCSRSAPIIKEDALNLVDGLTALFEWQSTLAYLKNPPEGYLLAGVDLLGGITKVRDQVSAGAFSNEVDFQTNLTALIGQAHDGHLLFLGDALNVFAYERANIGNLVSISADGTSIPQVYVLNDLEYAEQGLNTGWTPSPITMIDGHNATEWLTSVAENGTIAFQDPDTMYNALFASLASGNGQFLTGLQSYTGPSTSLSFANGTTQTYDNAGLTRKNFTGVNTGTDFYDLCCNATAKLLAVEASNFGLAAEVVAATISTATSAAPVTAPTSIDKEGYPSAVAMSSDGSVAGYFLNGTGFEKTAVLSISQETEADPLSAQSTLAQFLDACRNHSMENLIIDLQANPGGSILLGYDFFKQLFPLIDPYVAGNMRAQPQLDVLGSFVTPIADEALKNQPKNLNNFENEGGYTIFDASTSLDESGKGFQSWSALYGPRKVHGDDFTRVIRRNVSDPNFDEEATGFGIVVSGYGNRSDLAPQPFKSANMILLTDGECSSTCTIFGHLMKWQGKVKSVTVGGRPRNGPMQYIGGVKGSQVYNLPALVEVINLFYENADEASIATANTTGLSTLNDLGEYVQFRSADPVGAEASEVVTFNLQNNIAEEDASTTPLQFVYEAADCRLWWMEADFFSITNLWTRVAANAFGLNGTRVFGQCVKSSTNAPSSLSGDAKLFDGGKADNVTTFESDQFPSTSSSASPSAAASSTSGGPSASATAKSEANKVHGLGKALVVVALSALGMYFLG